MGEDQDVSVYDVDSSDPQQILIDRTGMAAPDIRQISELMAALGQLREAEEHLSEASRRYMRLNETDMRALHYLIVCAHQNFIATPGGISHHLRISSASTTKLLDRLERGGHIIRAPHPTDRRALAISITPETHQAAMETVGRQQAKRFYAAARLTPAERDVVIRFVRDMAQEIAPGDEPWAQPTEE
ncbi:DNA-binding MarR family transcriptional regulator [Microbacterium sp. W4I4]|uniref:MarR family winged helix-turn-helix transcriptional regulator n=1 Tax=Microbacterium sp. W4I4 TaxID=3042295 RepID=UPI002782E4FD|nr:MarR family transcriptional regulator [Microbacterium sp. W4I4]MDQ0612420.1 DNA-binding MarR family transcriptional regulator [Microbacterium sp. W4I4]